MNTPMGNNAMALGEADVERMVREVLARLKRTAESPAKPSAPGGAVPSAPGGAVPPAPAGGVLAIDHPLVTAAELSARLDGVSHLQVARGAVITPAARDLLREKGVLIATGIKPHRQAANGAKAPVVSGVAGCSYDPAGLLRWLSGKREVQQLASSGLGTVVAELTEQVVRSGAIGILWTDASAAAICLANRQRGVRAVLGQSPAYVASAVAHLAANVLVIDPAGRSFFEMRSMLAALTSDTRPKQSKIPID